ncbi:MAG: hypothetical protein ACLS8R_08090 [Anaeromassilibacillus sp.]
MVKELDRTIQKKWRGGVAPPASELADTGTSPWMRTLYNITPAEDGTVTYQGEDTAAAFTAEEDAYVDDTSRTGGDGTKESPFLIMNAAGWTMWQSICTVDKGRLTLKSAAIST